MAGDMLGEYIGIINLESRTSARSLGLCGIMLAEKVGPATVVDGMSQV